MRRFIFISKTFFFEDTQNGFFLSSRLLGFSHSSLFQCVWNFQPRYSWFASFSLLFILFSSYCYFLLNFLFFSGGSFCNHFPTYQSPTIACNNNLRFSFGLGLLGSLTGIFLNNSSIKWVYKWQRSKKLCSKDFSQQPTTYMAAPSNYNASSVEVIDSGQLPPLLPSSHLDYWCSLSYASI